MSYGSAPPGGAPKRLTRSSREKMLTGVAGGMGEYFDVDPVVIRLLWVAAVIITGGIAIPAYIVMAIIMPPDDRVVPHEWASQPTAGPPPATARPSSEGETMSDEATTADTAAYASSVPGQATDESGTSRIDWTTGTTYEPSSAAPSSASAYGAPPPSYTPRDASERRQRTAAFVLIALGVLFLAGQSGIFDLINWRVLWPLILVGAGIALLVRQNGWRR